MLRGFVLLQLLQSVFSFAPPRGPWRVAAHPVGRKASPAPHTDEQENDDAIECDVAVFGGGFGGLYTALALQRNSASPLRIVLVEPTERFVFLPLLYDLTVGTATETEVCPLYRDLLRGTGIQHVRATLDAIHASDKVADVLPVATTTATDRTQVRFTAGVMAVGASPESIIQSVPGATDCAQPFYTGEDAKATKALLDRLEGNQASRIAVVGGGFGGVELAASIQRRLYDANVSLLSRGKPMAGTRAEPLVDQALRKLGVAVEEVSVDSLEREDDGKIMIHRAAYGTNSTVEDDLPWDAVLWTAGSLPALPESCEGLQRTTSGRLAVEDCLMVQADGASDTRSCIFALGDCAEVPGAGYPKTASVAVQQAPIVAGNVQKYLAGRSDYDTFRFTEIGSLLTLGGPNGAAIAPKDSALAPLVSAGLDFVDGLLSTADRVWQKTPIGLKPDEIGLSIGSYGLGVEGASSPGTIAGSVTGGLCYGPSSDNFYSHCILVIILRRYPQNCICSPNADELSASSVAGVRCGIDNNILAAGTC